MLCAPRRVHVGHLFLIGEQGLGCVASVGGSPPPDGLVAFAADQISNDLRLSEMETGMLSESLARDAPSAATWGSEGSEGERFHALVLNAMHEGTQLAVGVVALKVGNARASVGSLNQLATALGSYLLRVGDAQLRGG